MHHYPLSHKKCVSDHKTSKMAAKSIATELLSLISPFHYISKIDCLTTDDFMTVRLFQKTELGKMFWIDKSKCYINGLFNNLQLFEQFGHFSDEDAESIRSDIIEQIESGSNLYKTVSKEFFAIR